MSYMIGLTTWTLDREGGTRAYAAKY